MPKPKKRKRKIKLSQRARVRKKNEEKNDTMPKAPAKTVLPTNGITFKVKMRKK
jgi:hypothetical protein